jgi:5-methylcytosine-specific restriction endonuclease McrA
MAFRKRNITRKIARVNLRNGKPPGKTRGKVHKKTKLKVLKRDKYTCQCCKNENGFQKLEVHHIRLKSRGGSHHARNLITICNTCHSILHLCLSAIFKDLDRLEEFYNKRR